MEEGFRSIADTVQIKGREQVGANVPLLVRNWLSNKSNGKWIIVLDSADDIDVFYGASDSDGSGSFATYLPQSSTGSILITTRDRDLAFRLTGNVMNIIEVGPMNSADAVTLVQQRLGSISDSNTDGSLAAALVKALDYVPLAVTQAAAYIVMNQPFSSVQTYLTDLHCSAPSGFQQLEKDAGDPRRVGAASSAIFSTWQMSFDVIRNKRPSAADLLSLMSFFDHQAIPEWVLKSNKITMAAEPDYLVKKKGIETDPDDYSQELSAKMESTKLTWLQRLQRSRRARRRRKNPTEQTPIPPHPENNNATAIIPELEHKDDDFVSDVMMLRNYSLISVEKHEFSMHRLVQLATKRWLQLSQHEERFKQQFITLLQSSFPDPEYENWSICQTLFPHAQLALDYRPSEGVVRQWAQLCLESGDYAQKRGKYDISRRMFSRGKEFCEAAFEQEDDLSLELTSELAWVLSKMDKYDEALDLQRQVLKTRKAKLGTRHPDTVASMGDLAVLYSMQGQLDKAVGLEEQVLEASKKSLSLDHPNTLVAMGNLAATYSRLGRTEEAVQLQDQVLKAQETKLGADHPDTIMAVSNIAITYSRQGGLEKAVELQDRVLQAHETSIGVDHPVTLAAMRNIAITYVRQGQLDKAIEVLEQTLAARKESFGVEHPETLVNLSDLAQAYTVQGRVEDALHIQECAFSASKRALGMGHPDTLRNMSSLALRRWDADNKKSALSLMHESLRLHMHVFGSEDSRTQWVKGTLEQWESMETAS